jgi:hypothetical protein
MQITHDENTEATAKNTKVNARNPRGPTVKNIFSAIGSTMASTAVVSKNAAPRVKNSLIWNCLIMK